MDERKLLFTIAFVINIIAFGITVYLLDRGMIEENPIMSKMFSNGLIPSFLFIITMWLFLYFILIYMPEKAKKDREVWIKASKYACAILAILTMIDFLNDYIWLMISL